MSTRPTSRPRLLLVMCGEAPPEVVQVGGNYDQWFKRAVGDAADLEVRHAFLDQPLGPVDGYAGLIVSGSAASVCDQAAWMTRLGSELREAARAGRPILGVCFGHQLLAEVFGGRVELHPAGREIGTIEVELTSAGRRAPLFSGLGQRLRVNATHGDHVARTPEGAIALAHNEHSPLQAFQVGERAFGVQFHPELDRPTMQAMIRRRREELLAEARARGQNAEAHVDRLHDTVEETEAGPAILRNFAEQYATRR